jgi:O-antigen/teichoic acid export membrane protein
MSTMRFSETRAAARDVVLQVIGRTLNVLMGVVVTALVVRALGDEGFGRWVTVLAVVQVADYFTSFGLEPVAVRLAAAGDERERDRWVDGLVSLRLALSLPAAVVAVALLLVIEPSREMRITAVLLAATIVCGAPGVLRARFQLRMRNDVPVAITTVNSVVWGVAAVALYLGDAGIIAFAIAFLGAALLAAALQVVTARRLGPIRLGGSRRYWPELLRVGVPVGIGGLLILAYARIDQVLVFELAGEREAGLYGAVYRILDQAQLVPIALLTTIAPLTAAAAVRDPERLRTLVAGAAQLLVVVSLGALSTSIVLAEPLVVLLFGEDFRPAADALPVLTGAFVVICLGYLAGNLVLVYDLQKRFLRVAVVALVVNVAANLVLIPKYGFMAAAWVTLLTEIVAVGPPVVWGIRRIGWRPPAGPFARALTAAVLSGAVLEGLELAGAPAGVLLALAGPLYVGLVLVTGAVQADQVRMLLRRGAPPEGV